MWTETWLRHFGALVPHCFAICRRDGQPCAVALITRSLRRTPGVPAIRTLHLGTAGEASGTVFVEWNRFLCRAQDRSEAAEALMRRLQRRHDWDELRLDGFDPDHAHSFLARGYHTSVRRERSPTADLRTIRGQGRDVLDALSAGVQRRLRQSLRAFGTVELEWAQEVAHGMEILDELAALHTERWQRQGQPGAFAHPAFAGFHRDLVSRLLPDGGAILVRVRRPTGTIGCLYCLADGLRVLFYQGGFTHFGDNRLRGGLVTHLLCMQACLERGFDEYDFLAGDARYKDELSTGARELLWVTVRRSHLRFVALAGVRAAQRAVREYRAMSSR